MTSSPHSPHAAVPTPMRPASPRRLAGMAPGPTDRPSSPHRATRAGGRGGRGARVPTWHVERTRQAGDGGEFVASVHAVRRMDGRGVAPHAVDLVLTYGRVVRSRHLRRYFLGRREVDAAAARGLDLRAAENVHVLVAGDADAVVTVYRNRSAPPRH